MVWPLTCGFLHGDWILKVSGFCSELRMYSRITRMERFGYVYV